MFSYEFQNHVREELINLIRDILDCDRNDEILMEVGSFVAEKIDDGREVKKLVELIQFYTADRTGA